MSTPLRELHRAAGAVLLAIGDEAVRIALTRYLSGEKLRVLATASAAEAVALAQAEAVGCAVLDFALAEAAEAVPRIAASAPGVGILVLVSKPDRAAADQAIERGALEVLETPVKLQRLGEAVRHALRRRDAMRESDQIDAWLREEVSRATDALKEERVRLHQISVAALQALVNALEAKDPSLRGHSARVADLGARVAVEWGADPDLVDTIRTAGLLHDVGKIGIRDQVLEKQGPLTDEEFEHIKSHPNVGARILAPLTHWSDAIAFIRSHHEHWNGKGYPEGLAGEAIPIGARIIGAAEIFDALTTARPYQSIISAEQAVIRMRELVGTVLDPRVHEALERAVGSRAGAAAEPP